MFLRRTGFLSVAVLSMIALLSPSAEADSINCLPGFNDCAAAITTNGSAAIIPSESVLRLTDNLGQAGSAFFNTPVNITTFTTSFAFRFHDGTQPNPADGITFTIQGNGPTALGDGGGGLGYAGIGNSVAIKFDTFNNQGESDNSTGLFINGQFPGSSGSIPLDPTGINLRDQDLKRADISYDGTTLTLTITDLVSQASLTLTFTANIPAVVSGDTAFVGFTGGTGGLFAVQDIATWTFESPITAQAIENLKNAVQALVDQGVVLPANGQSLQAKLNAALGYLSVGDIPDTIGTLQAFINQVNAFIRVGTITPAQGQSLIDAATAIIHELGG
jgi:hypothetical protein